MTTAVKRIKGGQPVAWRSKTVSMVAFSALMHSPVWADDDCLSGDLCTIDNGNTITVENETRDLRGLTVGSKGKGTLDIDKAKVNVNSHIQVGYDQGSEGIVLVRGDSAQLTSRLDLNIGIYGTGWLEISEGGHVITQGNAKLGRREDGDGTVLVSGNGSRWEINDYLAVGDNHSSDGTAQGTLTINQGGFVSAGDGAGGPGTVYVGRYDGATGTINIGAEAGAAAIAGGTLDAAELIFGPGTGTLVFNHTAPASGGGLEFVPTMSGSGAIRHESGHTVLSGDNSGFSGETMISGGTLSVGGSNGPGKLGGTINVFDGGTLAGTGTVGSTTVASGGTLAPGDSLHDGTGTLTINGDLTLEQDAIVNHRLGSPGTVASPGKSDRIEVSGDLTLNGILNLAQSGDTSDGMAGLGYYRLMTYGEGVIDNGMRIGDTPSLTDPALYQIQTGGGVVDLFVQTKETDALQHWQGGDGVWDASSPQWLNHHGKVPVAWAGHHAVFKHQPGNFNGGTVTIEGTHAFQGLQFVDGGYRLEGTGSLATGDVQSAAEFRVLGNGATVATTITGDGGIAKTEKGTLVLSGDNTYRGGTHLLDGTLSVSSNANLGHQDGQLVFNGGTLQITGGDFAYLGRDITWGEHGGGFDIAHDDNAFTVASNLAGKGDLVKRGDGALHLTGTNAYGNTLIQKGDLYGNAQSISGNVHVADGGVYFEQTSNAAFSGNLSSDDTEHATAFKIGTGALTLSGHSSLNWRVEEGELITSAERFSGFADLNADGTLTFDQSQDATFSNTLHGTGQFKKTGSGLLRMTGDSAGFLGATTITGGTLSVGGSDGTGKLGGAINVSDGGTLAGAGTVGSGPASTVTIASGGTLAPGHSIGTLTIDGDLVFEAGSRFEVEVDPQGADSDQVAVTGNATLNGGTVAHIGSSGDYSPRSAYTILTAGGTLSGAFDEVTSDFAFLTPDLTYDYGAGTVDLALSRNERDFASAALTRNQRATANGIESIGPAAGHAVYDAIVQLPDDAALLQASYDALGGEIHASTKTTLIEDSRFIRHAAIDRVRAAFAAPGASSAPVSAYGPGQTPAQVSATHQDPVVWTQAFGSWGKTDGNGNAASLDRNTAGVLIGADRHVDNWRIGVLAGYSHSDFKARDRDSSGKSDNYHLGAYGGTQWDALGLRAGVAYTWHDIDTRRSVAMAGLNDDPRGRYHAGTLQAFGELGYGIEFNSVRLEPFANLAHVRLRTDGVSESGGATALSGRSDNTDVTFTTLGLRAEHGLSVGATESTLRGTVGWRHAFGNTSPKARHGFSAGSAFTITGAPIAKDSVVLEAGVDLNLTPSATFGLSYAGQLAGSTRDHGVAANLTVSF